MVVDSRQANLEDMALSMAEWARDNVHFLGAAVISVVTVINREASEVALKDASYATKLSRIPDPATRGEGDKGTDYLAMAHGKVDRRLRMELGIDVGEPEVRRGEDKATGTAADWLSESLLVIAAYSGCPTPEEDEVVATYGINEFHRQTIND